MCSRLTPPSLQTYTKKHCKKTKQTKNRYYLVYKPRNHSNNCRSRLPRFLILEPRLGIRAVAFRHAIRNAIARPLVVVQIIMPMRPVPDVQRNQQRNHAIRVVNCLAVQRALFARH